MKEKLLEVWEKSRASWSNLARGAKILILSGIGGALMLCLVMVAATMNKPTEYALLYNDLTTTDQAQALGVLASAGIPYKVEPSGAILVDEKDVNTARMQMATAGFPGNAFDYSTYSPGLTSTQADKDLMAVHQTQDRLQATIETIEEVTQAVVTISIPPKNAFALQSEVREPTASVMIKTRPGRPLSPEQVQGILNIVKNGVAGLTEDNISISDTDGDLKVGMRRSADANNVKLSLSEEINAAARDKILNVLRPRFGPRNVEASVSSVLDTDDKTSETIQYNPFNPDDPGNTSNPVDYTEHDRQKVGDGNGVAQGVPGANDNVGVPQYAEEDAELAAAASYSSHDIYDYLVGSTKEQITKNGLKIEKMTVSVVVNAKTLADGERDQLIALVANASGAAVENVTLVNYEFAQGEKAAVESPVPGMSWQQILLYAGIALLLLIILSIVVIVLISKRKKEEPQEEEALEGEEYLELEYDEEGNPILEYLEEAPDFEPIVIVETQEQKLKAQIKDLADSDPEIVAQLIKTWLVSG